MELKNTTLNRQECRDLAKKRGDMSADEAAMIDWSGNLEELDTLLAKGVHIDTHTNSSNRSILVKCVISNHPENVRALLERGANPNFDGGKANTPLLQLGRRHANIDQDLNKKNIILGELLQYGSRACGIFERLSYQGDDATIAMFIDRGVEFNYRDFCWAVESQMRRTYTAMAKTGFVIEDNISGRCGSPTQEAVVRKDLELLILLLKTGHKPWLDHHAMKRMVSEEWKQGIETIEQMGNDSQMEVEASIQKARTSVHKEKTFFRGSKYAPRPKGVAPTLAQVQAEIINSVETRTSPPKSGWVYVMSNPYMPGLIKIGYTRQGAEKRAQYLTRDLEITAVPGRFSVDLEIPTKEPELLENTLHILFSRKRAERGEFFHTTAEDVASVVRLAGLID